MSAVAVLAFAVWDPTRWPILSLGPAAFRYFYVAVARKIIHTADVLV